MVFTEEGCEKQVKVVAQLNYYIFNFNKMYFALPVVFAEEGCEEQVKAGHLVVNACTPRLAHVSAHIIRFFLNQQFQYFTVFARGNSPHT